MKSAKKIHEDFWKQKVTEENKYKDHGPVSLHIRNILFDILDDLKFKTLLDVGCGQGTLLSRVSMRYPKTNGFGIDISDLAILKAKEKNPQYAFKVLDISKNKIRKKWDLIIMLDVLEHIKNDVDAIKNVRQMSGKYLVISTLIGRMRKGEEGAGHVRNYKLKELVEKLEKNKFKIVKIVKWGFPFYSPIYRNILEYLDTKAKKKTKLIRKSSIEKWPWHVNLFAKAIYYLMKLNLPNKGDFVFILSKSD